MPPPRYPDCFEEISDTCERKAKHGLVDKAANLHLLMHAADDDPGMEDGPCLDRRERLIRCCARTPPMKAGEAVIVSTGFFLNTDSPWGREAPSSAFFRTPDMPRLYSEEIMITPSLAAMAERRARTGSGACLASSSSLQKGNPCSGKISSTALGRGDSGWLEFRFAPRITDKSAPSSKFDFKCASDDCSVQIPRRADERIEVESLPVTCECDRSSHRMKSNLMASAR